MDGGWDPSQSILSLDNEQEFLIRLSSLGFVAMGGQINRVWSTFRIIEIIFWQLGTLCFSDSAIFHGHLGARMNTRTIILPLRKEACENLPTVT